VYYGAASYSETVTDAMHNSFATPVVIGDYIYGVDSYGRSGASS